MEAVAPRASLVTDFLPPTKKKFLSRRHFVSFFLFFPTACLYLSVIEDCSLFKSSFFSLLLLLLLQWGYLISGEENSQRRRDFLNQCRALLSHPRREERGEKLKQKSCLFVARWNFLFGFRSLSPSFLRRLFFLSRW